MRFAFIGAEKARHSVPMLCRMLRVSASGYYAWRRRGMTPFLRHFSDQTALLHQPRHALAADVLAELAEVVEHARTSVRATAFVVGRHDQRTEPRILERPPGRSSSAPRVVPAR